MELIAQANRLCQHCLPFGHQQIKHDGVVLRCYLGKGGAVLAHQPGDGMCIKAIVLIDLSCASAALSRPAGIDLEDHLVVSNKELGKSTSIVPSAFDSPMPWL